MLVATGMPSLVHALIDINLVHLFQNGNHPLWYASYRGRTDLVKLFLNSRANIDLATEVCGCLN